MGTWSRWCVVAALSVACGDAPVSKQAGMAGAVPSEVEAPAPVPPTVAPPVAGPQRPCGGRITLRLLGVDAEAVRGLELELAELEVSGGTVVEGTTASRVDLVEPGARRLALVELASDSEELVASVQPIGGRAVVGDRVVALDTCTAPIAVRFRPEQVHPERCHAVIHLALAASLADAPLQPALLALLPSFTLHF